MRRVLRGTGLLPLVLALLLPVTCSRRDAGTIRKPTVQADATWPNVLLISVDTLRPDHLGCYGYQRPTSPRIDQLAAEGALFENAISSTSWTLPAHAALFTGLADSVHRCQDMDQRLADSHTTLAERLQAAGYATVGFFSGPALHPVFGLGQGFDKYVDCTSFKDLTLKVLAAGQSLDGGVVQGASNADVTNPRVFEEVRNWLHDHQRRPFFMFVHLWDVHFDFIPPPPYDRMFDPDYTGTVTGQNFLLDPAINAKMPPRDIRHLMALYDGEIAWTDAHVGRILDELDALNLRDSTIVMLVADHGEEFFEHGHKGHRHTLFDEVIRIPWIVRYPGRLTGGLRVPAQVRIIDVMPTVLELLGMPLATDVMGSSRVPLLEGTPTKPTDGSDMAVSELFSAGRELRSFRRLEGKLIRNEQNQQTIAFDLRADPAEKQAVVDTRHPLLRQLQTDMERATEWLNGFRKRFPAAAAAPKLPDDVRRQLESLGYVGGDDAQPDTAAEQQPSGSPTQPDNRP
ncbi:MAG TPA: sulfatase [Phycisphaerae bacterium]|nr:sulfatase [Phycisphaerae bacterium]HNU45714.1 sulfatase [Phycisphaerae bacterium]